MRPRQDTWIISNLLQNLVVNLLLNNKITLLTNKNHSFEANLEYIAKELDNRNNDGRNNGKDYEYNYILKDSLSLRNLYDFASSKYVFLAKTHIPMFFWLLSKNNKHIFYQENPTVFYP